MKRKPTGPGGARDGAGRPLTHDEPKTTLSVRITPTLKRYLAESEKSAGDTIEDTIRRSAAFRDWKRQQPPTP